jgi:hypothetical protein
LATLAGSLAPARVGAQDDWGDEAGSVEVHGFAEAGGAGRLQDDPTLPAERFVMNETRFRLDLAHYAEEAEFHFKGDFLSDALGEGVIIDVRQMTAQWRAADWLDVRIGRQVLTWGTGDFVFLNDLFPKDWVSFFIGRDDEYLKAPSNSVKLTLYTRAANLDLVWTPIFEPDRYITGERLGFFSPAAGKRMSSVTMGAPVAAVSPPHRIEDGELAARLFRNVRGFELALYGYVGYSKRPLAFDPSAGMPAFSPLAVGGASVRGNILGGIASFEGAYYDSYKDADGTDPFRPNSEIRWLAGYEREIAANFNAGLQYYAEWIQDYDELIAHSPAPQYEPEEIRNLATLRLNYRALQQTLTLSLFGFYSPNDEDGHVRPAVSYKWSDAVNVTVGANVMFGDQPTFFGQLEENSNAYVRVRYSF